MKVQNSLAAVLIALAFIFSAQAQFLTSGALDPAFGQRGKVSIPTPGEFHLTDMALQSDGKIVATGLGGKTGNLSGYFAVARYNSNGILDANFGGGINFYTLTGAAQAKQIVVQEDGRIIVAGKNSSDLLLIRLNSDGGFDTSFGINGLLRIDFSDIAGQTTFDSLNDIKIQDDGKILVAGISTPQINTALNSFYTVARVSDDGVLDTTFGVNGKILGSYSPINRSGFNAITLQPDGKIVAVGYTYTSSDMNAGSNILSVRFNSNGMLDETFGVNGSNAESIKYSAIATDSVVQPDGKIIIVGRDGSSLNATDEFFLLRYNVNGSLDESFANHGVAFLDFITVLGEPCLVKLQSDGKILLLGSFVDITIPTQGFILARYSPNGVADPTFGSNGIVLTTFGVSGLARGNALLIQPDGRILAGGIGSVGFPRKSSIVRYLSRRQRGWGKF